MEKKGLTARFVIILVVLVISLIVILYALFQFAWTGTINRETCYSSVTYRDSLNRASNALQLGSKVVPLRCKTYKVCFQSGGRDACELEFGRSSFNDPIEYIKLSEDDEVAKNQILDVMADQVYDCHKMLGEGKLNFLPHDWSDKNYCPICTRFAFDDETAARFPEGILYMDY
jgi:hypothetical protein